MSDDVPTPMSTSARVSATDATAHPNRWRILVVLCLGLMVIMIANGSLNVALPQLADDLDASASALQWMVDAYSLVFAGLLFTAGTLGDRFGRRRALQGGMVLFLVGAVAASLADTAGQVIAARAVMGGAAAFVMPSTLSLLVNVFPPDERPRAIAVWAGIAAGGAAFGPPISGFLVEHFWWGSVFLINVPLLIIAIAAGRRLLPESKDPGQHRLDVPGAVLSILGLGALVYAIIEAPGQGWGSAQTLVAFATAGLTLFGFVIREATASEPMFDLRLVRDVRFSVASLGISVCFFAVLGVMFLLAQYLQMVLGFSPFHAGLLILPLPLVMMAVAPQAPKLVARFGISRVVPAGMGLIAGGLCLLSALPADAHGWAIYPAMLPAMVGMAVTLTPFTAMVMTSVPPERAGMGSATNDTTRELGLALGVAVLGSVVTTHYRSSIGPALDTLPVDVRTEAGSGLPGALQAARSLPTDAGRALAESARVAFTDGLGTAAILAAALVAATAIVATLALRRSANTRTPAPVDPVDVASATT
jgi:EmrB/QacA subfamily drug resistance transporter